MHFAREAIGEMEELIKCVEWKRKEKEEEERRIEAKEVFAIMRWLQLYDSYIYVGETGDEELAGLVGSIARVFREAMCNYTKICDRCINSFRNVVMNKAVNAEALLNGRSVGAVLEEVKQFIVIRPQFIDRINFFKELWARLWEGAEKEKVERKRKELKRKVFDMLEEEGYEEIITTYFVMYKIQFKFLPDSDRLVDYYVYL
eukprot:MONOS_14636.1-p1 / transcript=MONOS_14636.1 / gene=MONOS_14636 / organism=Monocercomonoides_exilis_PA203 / gene_product=unspecified product / transcript_product=unspecified product / location=Mono_scaffold01038:15906-16511(+) / protein_length=202 / sequence_SO=supercontig / SO=protein_coding / is_pseudo=false